MKSRKKNKRKTPKRARAKRRCKIIADVSAVSHGDGGGPARPFEDHDWALQFKDALSGVGGQRGWKVLGRGIKRPVRSGRKAKKTEIFREAEKLRAEGFSYAQIAKKLTLDAFKEDPRKAGEAIRQGVLRLRERPSTSIGDCITVEQDPNADAPKPAV